MRVKKQIKGQSQTRLRNDHFNKAKQFQSTESRKKVDYENKRMAEKLYSIQYGHSPSRENLKENDSIRKLQANNLIKRKRVVYDNLNKDNLRMHDRLTSQKGQINFSKLENEFARNREHIDRMTKYKFDGDKVLFGGCLIAQDGRFRVPGSKYTSIKNLQSNSRRGNKSGEDSRLSVCSSQRSARSRQSSQLSNRKISTQNGMTVNSRSASKNKLRVSGGDFFEQKKAPEISFRNTTKSKGFLVKKGPSTTSYTTKPLGGVHQNHTELKANRIGSHQRLKRPRPTDQSLSRTALEF